MDEYDAFADRLRELLSGSARELSRQYWEGEYTGRFFDVLADHDHPNEITERDVVAVSTLSVTVPAPVTIWLLSDEGRAQVTKLLSEIPTDIDIWDAGELLERDRELWSLWKLLEQGSWPAPTPANDMGRTKISKLMAAKRPRLVPIFDSVVEKLFPPVANYWTAFERSLSQDDIRRLALEATTAGAPEQASLLRKLDVLLWMLGKQETSI